MKGSSTRWLVGLALGLLAFIVFFERGTLTTDKRRVEEALLLPSLEPRRVTDLEIRQGTNRLLNLERGTNTWYFRAPVLYPARSDSVDAFLARLAQTPWRARISPGEVQRQTNGLAAFGLAPPARIVTVVQDGERTTLHLGNRTAIGSQIYSQVVGQQGLYTLDADLLAAFPAGFDAWRDTTLLSPTKLDFDRLQVRPLTNGFEVVRDPTNRVWQMTKPLATRANSALLEHLMSELDLLRVARFVSDNPGAELESFGLLPPQRELVFSQGTNDLLGLQLGRSPGGDTNLVYARLTTFSNVVLVSRAPLAPWLDAFRDFFCDRRLMIFDLTNVTRLEAQADEAFAVQQLTNGTWQIVKPFTAPADTLLVMDALAEMAGMEFIRYEREVTTDFASYGLAPPRREYLLEHTVTNETGVTNLVIARADFGNPAQNLYYARRSLEDSVVLALDPIRLPRAAFQLRDRRIWNVSTNDVVAITVEARNQSRKVVRTGPMQWALAEGVGGPPNPVSLEEAAYRLGHLQAERWVARGEDALPRFGIGAAGHQVTLELKPGMTPARLTLRFGRRSASGGAYAAVELPGQPGPVVFECPVSIYEFVLSDLSLGGPVGNAGP